MKKLHGLTDQLPSPNNRTAVEQVPRYVDVIVDSLTHLRAKNGTEAIKNVKLAQALVDAKPGTTFEIEDADMDRLSDACEQNPYGYLSWAHGYMMLKIQEWVRGGQQ